MSSVLWTRRSDCPNLAGRIVEEAEVSSARRPCDLQELYIESYGFVRQKASAILSNDADANEVTQEVYLRAHENWSKVRAHPSPIGWLLTTTARVAIDRLRHRRVRERRDLRPVVTTTASPEGAVEAAGLIQQVLAETSELGRDIASCVYLDGMTQEETAMVLEVSRKTVQRHLTKLRTAMTEAADE